MTTNLLPSRSMKVMNCSISVSSLVKDYNSGSAKLSSLPCLHQPDLMPFQKPHKHRATAWGPTACGTSVEISTTGSFIPYTTTGWHVWYSSAEHG